MPTRLSKRARGVQPSATLALGARAAELRKKGVPVITLVAGEPDFDTPEHAKAAAVRAIGEGFTKYTDASGMPELRKAVADKLLRENAVTYQPSEIVISCGAKHALYNLLQALVDEGDEVLLPSPYWVSYPDMIALAGGKAIPVPCKRPDFHLDLAALEKAITPRTRILLLNSPNNPTGAVYTESELRGALELCRKHNLFVVSDEIYEKLVYPSLSAGARKFASIATIAGRENRDRVAVVNGCSKAYAMTGWRIGYAAGPADLMKAVADIQSQSTSNPASISQKAALAALAEPDPEWEKRMVAEFDARRRMFRDGLVKIPGVECCEPEGAFYVFPKVDAWYGKVVVGETIRNSDDFARLCLEKAHVAFVPGEPFGDDRHVRFSYATSRANLEETLKRLQILFA